MLCEYDNVPLTLLISSHLLIAFFVIEVNHIVIINPEANLFSQSNQQSKVLINAF